jgi:hypothetical protein
MSRHALAIAVVAVLAANFQASAEGTGGSLYTQAHLNGLKRQNSTSGYSTAQVKNDVVRKTVPQYSYSTVNRNLFSSNVGASQPQKPFSNVSPRGGVSPYLGLSAPFSSTAEQYYAQVRPQIDQQRVNQQMEQRNAQLQHQLNSVAAKAPYDVQGSDTMTPTGHVAVFMNYGGYYPDTGKKK